MRPLTVLPNKDRLFMRRFFVLNLAVGLAVMASGRAPSQAAPAPTGGVGLMARHCWIPTTKSPPRGEPFSILHMVRHQTNGFLLQGQGIRGPGI